MTEFTWSLPQNLLAESIKIMRPHGLCGNEGLALWFGEINEEHARVSHVVEVFGKGFQTTPLFMQLSLKAMASLTDLSETLDVALVGQIHSHPGVFIDLSLLDIEKGIRSPNYLSVVCPYYAQRDLEGYRDCGVHVFECGSYRKLNLREIQERLKISNQNLVYVRHEVLA